MTRYARRPHAVYVGFDEEGQASLTADEVLVPDDDTPLDTGLLDADGNKLYRVSPRKKLGFAI